MVAVGYFVVSAEMWAMLCELLSSGTRTEEGPQVMRRWTRELEYVGVGLVL